MGLIRLRVERRFCAFCGADHRVYMKRHISTFDVVVCTVIGLLVVAPFSDTLDPRGIAVGAIFIGIAEVFVGIRHRMSMKCGRCGFDPIIYRRSQEDAARLVREHLARRRENPANLLVEPIIAHGRKAARDKARAREKTRHAPPDSTQHP